MKESWLKLYQPITENMKLDMRMNLKSKKVNTPWCPARALAVSPQAEGLKSRSNRVINLDLQVYG